MNKSISCGNCKGTHASVSEVKTCYYNDNRPVSTDDALVVEDDLLPCERKALETGKVSTAVFTQPAITPKQEAFLNKLLAERPAFRDVENLWPDNVAKMTKADASATIERTLKVEKEATQAKPEAEAVALEDGVYSKDGVITMVYHTVHGRNVQVGKVLHVTENADGTFNGEFVYGGKAALKGLTPANLMSQDEAKQFGSVYGFCVRCARTLTKEESKHVGYGETCANHQGWWYPTKVELKALALANEAAK